MKHCILPLFIILSAALHAAILLCTNKFFTPPPETYESAKLDVSSVELTMNEEDAPETPAIAPVPPPPPEVPPLTPPKTQLPEIEPPEVPPEPLANLELPEIKPPELPVPDADSIFLPKPPEEVPPPPPVVEEPKEEPAKEETPPPEPPPPPPQEIQSAPSSGSTGHVDAPAKPLAEIKPKYPIGSRTRGEEGKVSLRLYINERGRVSQVDILSSSGFAELDNAARSTALRAKFQPAKIGRKSVPSTATITLTYQLHN